MDGLTLRKCQVARAAARAKAAKKNKGARKATKASNPKGFDVAC